MFTLTILTIFLTPVLLLALALRWERQKNKRLGQPNLEHAPMVMAYHVSKAYSEHRYNKAKAKYDVLKASEEYLNE